MADEQYVSQGGATVATELLAGIDEQQVSQGGVTVATELLIDVDAQLVSQGGITIVCIKALHIYAYDVAFEAAIQSNVIHPYGIAMETVMI